MQAAREEREESVLWPRAELTSRANLAVGIEHSVPMRQEGLTLNRSGRALPDKFVRGNERVGGYTDRGTVDFFVAFEGHV